MTDQDHQEGYNDGIAGRDMQDRTGQYLAGYALGAVDRAMMFVRQLLAIVAPPVQPVAHKLLEDE